jgi:endo-1,4-beta-mannosidase
MRLTSKIIAFVTLIVLQCSLGSLMAQSKLEIGSKYLKLNGKSTFINGANYIPSKGWLQILDNWNAKAVEQDMDSLHGIGVDFIRFMPLWYLTQPEKNKFDQQKIDRLNELINIAGKRGIKVQPSLITGYVSGGLFSPAWIDKKMFIDPSQIDGEIQMIRTITKSLSGNPYVHSYDFGNELL